MCDQNNKEEDDIAEEVIIIKILGIEWSGSIRPEICGGPGQISEG